MTAPPHDTTTDLHAVIVALRAERDAGLAREAALAEALAQRNSEYRERIEQQAATIDVLKAMSASPGDARPVFELIVERARSFCGADHATAALLQDDMLHLQAHSGMSAAYGADYAAQFPRPVDTSTMFGRAILSRDVMQTGNVRAERDHFARQMHTVDFHSIVAVPILREGTPVGAIALGQNASGGFTDTQIELLKTFAEQAVIAITSAETYRALQTRTSDLQETLEYQTATSDVLKVISRSTFDLQPVLDTVTEAAAQLCDADQAVIARREGDDVWRLAANFGFPPEFEAHHRSRGAFSYGPGSLSVGARAARERRPVHIHDAAAVPGYPELSTRLGKQRTSLGVPLLREGEAIGIIALARQRVEPFTNRQIELVSAFADQAVIAIENTRLITEQREALEQQTATAEILSVINNSPGELTPVFDAMLDRALRLCEGSFGTLFTFDGEFFHQAATRNRKVSVDRPFRPTPKSAGGRLLQGERFVHIADARDDEAYRSGDPNRVRLVDGEGARSYLAVSMRKGEELLGTITIYRQEVRPFTDKQIALLQNFAAQAVIAMENARLLAETREALEQQTATAEVLQVINANPGNLTPVFEAILDKAHTLCASSQGSLLLYEDDHFRAAAMRGIPEPFALRLQQAFRATETPATQPLLAGARFVHIPDLAEVDHPVAQIAAELAGTRTLLSVPLRKNDTLLGTITATRQEVRLFSEKEIALLQNFASQAVIAMENARLLTETREALEQQTATAEVLQVINASPGDLAPVFDAMLEKAMRLCEAVHGNLWTYDGERFRPVGTHGDSRFAEWLRQRGAVRAAPGTVFERMVQGEGFVHIADTTNDDGSWSREIVKISGAHAVLAVPLQKDRTLLGAIFVYRQEARPFSDKQIALLQNFAAQAVIAMENARLLTETREALEQQTATAQVLQVINSSPGDLAPVFDAILEKAHRLCGGVFGRLLIREGDEFHVVAAHGEAQWIEAVRQLGRWRPPEGAPLARLVGGERIVHIPDVREEDGYRDTPSYKRLIDAAGTRTMLMVPLRKDGALLGAITASRPEIRPFTDKQIALLENFAAQAVIAMENARLLNEIRQRQAELRTTFDNMGDGVAMFDTDLRLVAWNRNFQRIIDLSDTLLETRLRYNDYLRLLAERGEFGTTDIEAELSLRIEDTDKELRLERVRPDGRVIEVRRNAVPGGGFVLIYSDITERKRSEEEIRAARDAAETALRELRTAQANLIQAEKMASLGQLTAGIAHEIKNPLNFVNNFAALSVDLLSELKETAAPGFAALTEKQRAEVEDVSAMLTSNLEKINEHGKRADSIVKAMLEHSRGSSGERRTVDLNALIDEALNLAYHGARAQDQSFNITLERDFGKGIASIEINPQDITRVFLNIFANGFYAVTRRAREGGDARFVPTLKVTTIDAGETVEIRVRDNGTGIPVDIRDKLFQPFFTTKPTGEGTGLGLSITYDIVTQQHGGSIAVDSKVGEYSEFSIQLPRKP